MTIKQLSFCTFLLECKGANVLINPTKSQPADIKIFALKESPYLNYENNEGELSVMNAGEFEVKDVFINGRKNKNENSFAYNISVEGITLGVISFTKDIEVLPEDLFETTDVLLIGAGGGAHFDPKEANKLINKLTPSIAICFGFNEQASKDIKDSVESIEEAKKEIHGLIACEKSLKIDKDMVDSIDNTVVYYFNI